MSVISTRLRMGFTALFFLVMFVVVLVRALYVTVVLGPELKLRAARQHIARLLAPAERGAIVDRNGEPLALTVETADVFLHPRKVTNPQSLRDLANVLAVPLDELIVKTASEAPFVWVQRGISIERWDEIARLGLNGLGSERSSRRHYPHGSLAAHIIGFADLDGRGLEGLERNFDRDLLSERQRLRVERDARGRPMLVDGGEESARQGARLELTIDAALQHVVESELGAAVERHGAEAGMAVILDPRTGEVLAIATVPTYDPNQPAAYPVASRRNRIVTDFFEPGSTFKAITAAAALEAGLVEPDDRIHCENGRYVVGRRLIHDHDPFGWLTFSEVIRHSSNIGMAKVGEALGIERLSGAIAAFGFGKPTGIDLPGEAAGMVRPPERWGRIHLVTTSFGQGIAVTAIQLVRAFAAIANGGLILKPYVVRRVIGDDGVVRREQRPEVVGRAISRRTAQELTELLIGVVEEGTGTKAKLEGFAVAGKTGTAQKVDPNTGGYSARGRMSSFVGFVPADDPRLVILVVLDSPKGITYGGTVAAPVFRRLADYGLERLGLRPTRGPVPEPETAVVTPQRVVWKVNEPADGMPSFIGLSMREALLQAHGAGWQVEIHGSGFVIEQDPPPGTVQAPGDQLRLVFGGPSL